jgi:hypothetical protein
MSSPKQGLKAIQHANSKADQLRGEPQCPENRAADERGIRAIPPGIRCVEP